MPEHAAPRLLHVFATFDVGGPQVRTLDVCSQLGDQFEHGFVSGDGNTGASSLLADPRTPVFSIPRPASFTAQLRSIRGAIRRFRPDLVLSYNWGGILGAVAARLGRLPFIHHEETTPPEERERHLRRRTWIRRIVLRRASCVVCVAHAKQIEAREEWRIARDRCALIPNGVNTSHHAPSTDRTSHSWKSLSGHAVDADKQLVVGCVANARPEKNWERLMRSFAALRRDDVQLLFVGDGPDRRQAAATAHTLGIADRTAVVGHSQDTRLYYRSMDVFALPSDDEQQPIALLEAMAHGLPVVATDVGDVLTSLPREQRAFVADIRREPSDNTTDPESRSFTSVLGHMLTDRALRQRLGACNRRHAAAHHSIRTTAARYATVYGRAIQTHAPRGTS